MMQLQSQRVVSQQVYVILELVRLPKRFVRLLALPPQQRHVRLCVLLPPVLHILNHPP